MPSASGDPLEDLNFDDDLFNNDAVRVLAKKVKDLESERDLLKEQVNKIMKAHDQLRTVLIQDERTMKKIKEDGDSNTKVIEALLAEISSLNKNLQDVNQTLNQVVSEMSESTSNEMKVMKLEMEAMKADKVMKDEQLKMLYSVVKNLLKKDVHAAYNEIAVRKVEERRLERERRLAEDAIQKNKSIIEDVQEAGGSSLQGDAEMFDAEHAQEQHAQEQVAQEQVVQEQVVHDQDFMLVGEPSQVIDSDEIIRRVAVAQKKKKGKEVMLLEWKTKQFVLVGKTETVPLNVKDGLYRMKVMKRRKEAKKARGEEVSDSDEELLVDDEEDEDEEKNDDDEKDDDNKKDDDDKKNDDDDQGSSGLIVKNPIDEQRIEEFLNDQINEQEDDDHQETSTSGKQHSDQVFLTNPTVIFLQDKSQEVIEVSRTRKEMLEELGLQEGKFKFDIEDEIPETSEDVFETRYAFEADNYNDVIIEDASDSSDDEVRFHYSGIDATFPSLSEMFKDRNEEEIRRKIVEKVSAEGIPNTIPRENLAEERKKWYKVMPKERKKLQALQFFTHDKELSWGDILSWGYLEDLKVYAIRREQGVQYFEFLSDIKTLPWWDIDELVKTKNIKEFYHGLDVKQHDQKLWNYVKLQAEKRYPDWKPHFPQQIVRTLESGEKDITLDIKPPSCLKNMPLRAMEQDFHDEFEGWLYNQTTAEAIISLNNKSTREVRRICVLDPMWLVNCSKKDIDCLFYNKIVYERTDREQALQYQKVVDVCYAKDINSGRYWKTKWRDLEIYEFLKVYKHEQRFKKIAEKAAERGKRKMGIVPPTDQTPIESEENKIPRWERKRDGDPVYRHWWLTEGRQKRKRMLEERAHKRREKARERRRSRRN
ncbi:hypothetical protein HanRHA438_Chr01g0010681 [Helianthus annuus]|uniref:Uncharacterized protein n=1 Tax=Helianthus annuus TaxID=4232 RepID=A0A9K3P221_HELAN|nr:hypothetical protein HanXRQr2_Chr01g0010291 [Helianthus annuus]KAJ0782434.1 hypothetical protein HanLR1_Chr01g0008161 [Helianthus annuus]KAJ0947035.1 hypothetical protein HanRHA438_Chr01g0010681 [Helianthus annuus]